MRLRAAALLFASTFVLPAAAAAQQVAVADTRVSLPETSAPISRRDLVALESQLRHIALLQELYWTEHRTYAATIGDLEPATTGTATVEITAASSEGWTARVVHPSLHGVGCTMAVVAPVRAPRAVSVSASNGTAHGKRVGASMTSHSASDPVIVCDKRGSGL